MNNLSKAKEFCNKVKNLAKEYNLSVFIATDGTSLTYNNDNPCVKFHREKQIEWENQNGFNPNEDWSNDIDLINIIRDNNIVCDEQYKDIAKLMLDNDYYHMSISTNYKKYINKLNIDLYKTNLDAIKNKINKIIFITYRNKIVGYIIYSIREDYNIIRDLFVDKQFRNNKYGMKLVLEVIKLTNNKGITLTCFKENQIAIEFYKKLGFIIAQECIDNKTNVDEYTLVYSINNNC